MNHLSLFSGIGGLDLATGAGLCGGSGNFQKLKDLTEKGVLTEEERKNLSRGNGGQLNPEWTERLMGFPIGWTEIFS